MEDDEGFSFREMRSGKAGEGRSKRGLSGVYPRGPVGWGFGPDFVEE